YINYFLYHFCFIVILNRCPLKRITNSYLSPIVDSSFPLLFYIFIASSQTISSVSAFLALQNIRSQGKTASRLYNKKKGCFLNSHINATFSASYSTNGYET
ncbi:hypothetical protein BpHYR1_031285, partial [Brachionus plicatilis]